MGNCLGDCRLLKKIYRYVKVLLVCSNFRVLWWLMLTFLFLFFSLRHYQYQRDTDIDDEGDDDAFDNTQEVGEREPAGMRNKLKR